MLKIPRFDCIRSHMQGGHIVLGLPQLLLLGTVTHSEIMNTLKERQLKKNIATMLVSCFELNGHLRHYFSLYRTDCYREGERKEICRREKK